MVHVHKEICVMPEPPGKVAKWHHLDALHFNVPDESQLVSLIREVKEDPAVAIVMEWPNPAELTSLDYRFFGINVIERLHVSNKALARFRLRWNERFAKPFDSVFGSWPWDHLDAFNDPDHYSELKKEFGVKDCRIFLWIC